MSDTKIKMADVFELPVTLRDDTMIRTGADHVGGSFESYAMACHAQHAINNHDALVQHNAELTEALRDIVEDFAEIANPGKSSLIKARAALSLLEEKGE